MEREEMFEGEQGATYDPSANALALKIVGSGFTNRPQRYDRIFVKGEEHFHIAGFNKFGFLTASPATGSESTEPILASDHWGVRCVIDIGPKAPGEQASDEVTELVEPVRLKKATGSLADGATPQQTLLDLDVLPTHEQTEQRRSAFSLLKSVLVDAAPGEASDPAVVNLLKSSLAIVPVGSYGLGVWTAGSDIDCLCIGRFTSTTFFGLALARLRKAEARGVRILRRVNANTGTMLELDVEGVKMDLQYCPAGAVAEGWPAVLQRPASDPVFKLAPQTLAKLKAARDLDYLRRSVPEMAKFRTAHRLVKTWAKSRGVYSARFGYLGGIQISVLLARVCKLLVRDHGSVSVADILTTFFHHYAGFDWKTRMAFDPFFHRRRLQYARTPREPLAILGYFPPVLNTSHAASRPSVRTLTSEFGRASRLLSEPGMTWERFLCGDGAPSESTLKSVAAHEFLASFKSYVKIDVQHWGVSPARGASFVGWLESRLVHLLVDMHRAAPQLLPRIWPARFVEDGDVAETADGRDFQACCFLVGLDWLEGEEQAGEQEKEARKIALGALQAVLHRFEANTRSDEKYFDERSQWVGATVTRRAELGKLTVDERELGGYTPGEEVEDEDEESEEDLDEDLPSGGEEWPKAKARKGGKKAKQPVIVPAAEGKGKKFRPAEDVIKRLRWDPSLDSADFLVGYEDRFLGPRERALDSWKSEQSDLEFIPQHRVLYFKRKSDGEIVWERKTRIDRLFGSGV
jgi:uncharacterized protein (UPF0248 family)